MHGEERNQRIERLKMNSVSGSLDWDVDDDLDEAIEEFLGDVDRKLLFRRRRRRDASADGVELSEDVLFGQMFDQIFGDGSDDEQGVECLP